MLKEFLEVIAGQVTKSNSPQRIDFDFGPRESRFVINGEIHQFVESSPPLDYTVGAYEDFICLVRRFACNLIIIRDSEIVAYQDAVVRLDKIVWKRSVTPAFALLEQLAEGANFQQSSLIELLRTSLRNASGASTLLQAVRNLRFSKSDESASVMNRGEESLSQEVIAKMSQSDKLPEKIFLSANIYTDQDQDDEELKSYEIIVDPIPARQLIRLQSMADVIETNLRNEKLTMRSIIESALSDSQGISVVLGS